MLRFTEKAGLVGGQDVDHGQEFLAGEVLAHVGQIGIEVVQTESVETLEEPGLDQPFLAGAQTDTTDAVDQTTDPGKLLRM